MLIKNTYKIIVGITISCFVGIAATHPSHPSQQEVPYPENFRSWAHVKTGFIEKGSPASDHWGGFHHIYANGQAMTGYQSGSFPDGSILVFDVLEGIEKDNMIVEGSRKIVDVMVKDPGRFATTGGWGFEEFKGNSRTERLVRDSAATSCYNCHATRKEQGFVFSSYRP
jgi:hypothetical protein